MCECEYAQNETLAWTCVRWTSDGVVGGGEDVWTVVVKGVVFTPHLSSVNYTFIPKRELEELSLRNTNSDAALQNRVGLFSS